MSDSCKIDIVCLNCGKPFEKRAYQQNRNFCSRDCHYAFPYKKYDFSFLDAENPFRSWVLGWVVTDGTISSNKKRVRLPITDKEVVNIIRKKIGYKEQINGLIRKDKPNYKPTYEVTFYANVWKKFCELGFVPGKKSGFERIPLGISDETFSHFLRGVIEGDGCVYFKNLLMLNIVCMNRDFLQDIFDRLIRLNLAYGGSINGSNINILEFGHDDAVRILNYVYQNSDGMRLSRKYEKFMQGKDVVLRSHIQSEFCNHPGCTNKSHCRNLCIKHYAKEFRTDYRIKNREKINAINRKNYHKDIERHREYGRKYYWDNVEKVRERSKIQQQEYRDQHKDEINARRRANCAKNRDKVNAYACEYGKKYRLKKKPEKQSLHKSAKVKINLIKSKIKGATNAETT